MSASKLPLSPLDGRYQKAADPLRNYCSEQALVIARCQIEVAWLQALLHVPAIKRQFGTVRKGLLEGLIELPESKIMEQVKQIEQRCNHDVKAVELWLAAQLNTKRASKLIPLLHFGLTSWDVNNLAYGTLLTEAKHTVILPQLSKLIAQLSSLARQFSNVAMLGRTHSQPASPTTLGKEFSIYAHRLERARLQLANHKLDGKCNGAVGNYNALAVAYPKVNWPAVTRKLVEQGCGLRFNSHTTQIEPYDGMVELFDAIARANRIMLDLARDASLYAGGGQLAIKTIAAEVGSSTMPHKVNPIEFENCEGNLAIANSLLTTFGEQLQCSRLQRDLSDSTVLRNIGVGLGHCLVGWTSLERGLGIITANQHLLKVELADNWQVLAEAVQTVLRSLGKTTGYDLLKQATRGNHKFGKQQYLAVVEQLVPDGEAKQRLLKLTPAKYLGLATSLARKLPRTRR